MTSLSSPFSIRIATPADQRVAVALLEELIAELGPLESVEDLRARLGDDIATALDSPLVRIFLAEVSGAVIGLSRADVLTADPIFRLRADRRCGYVDQMYVRHQYRHAGIGRALLACCEDWFCELGLGYALLHAAVRATGFYERAGYSPNREMLKRLCH